MSIEALLSELTAAINANTAALLASGKGPSAPAGETKADAGTKKTTTKKTDTKPAVTFDQVSAAITKVKEEFGVPEAKKILIDNGVATGKLADVKEDQYAAMLAAADTRYTELVAAKAEEADDDL